MASFNTLPLELKEEILYTAINGANKMTWIVAPISYYSTHEYDEWGATWERLDAWAWVEEIARLNNAALPESVVAQIVHHSQHRDYHALAERVSYRRTPTNDPSSAAEIRASGGYVDHYVGQDHVEIQDYMLESLATARKFLLVGSSFARIACTALEMYRRKLKALQAAGVGQTPLDNPADRFVMQEQETEQVKRMIERMRIFGQ